MLKSLRLVGERICLEGTFGSVFDFDKVGRVFPMVIWAEFCMVQYRDDDHWGDAPHFNMNAHRYTTKMQFFS